MKGGKMNKKLILFFVFAWIALEVFVIAQGFPGSEVTNLFMFCDGATWSPTNFTTCSVGGTTLTACLENDGGYAPTDQATVVGQFAPMTTVTSGTNVIWNTGNYQCVSGTEYCVDGVNLAEVVCGTNLGITATNFGTIFPNNIWSCLGDPAALMYVNCATYAANNPGLGLTGACSAGACI